jgi:hypothetical protein
LSELPTKQLFSLHRSDGTVEHGLSVQELSSRILDGSVTEIDFISAAGGGPRPFWQFREFAPLSSRVRKQSSAGNPAQQSVASATALHSAAARPAISLGSVTRVTPALSQPSSASAPAQPSSGAVAAQPRTSSNPRIIARPARLFADNLLKLRPAPFRARLLDCSLPDIVGAGIDESPEAIAHAAQARIRQLQEHFEPRLFSDEDGPALEEAKQIILRAAATMVTTDRRDAILERAESIGRLPLFRELESLIPPHAFAQEVIARLLPAAPRTAAMEAFHPTDSLVQALESGTAVRRNLTAPDHTARRGSASEINLPAQRPSSPSIPAHEGPWGVGNADAGARAAMGPMVAVWVIAVGAVLLSDWGRFEHQLGLLDPLNLIRILLLVGATLLATLLLRHEPLARLGFAPARGWHWVLPLAGLAAGALLAEFWSFSFDRTAGIGAIVMIAALRAIGEGLFFEGHVARTMFVEARNPIIGMLLAAGGSAAYMASFFDVLRSETPITPIIVGLWFLLVGLPAALSMWVSRSVWVPIGFRFFVILALYLMQSGATV